MSHHYIAKCPVIYTVKPVYKGHSMEKQKVAIVRRWPLYRGHFIYFLSYKMFPFGRHFQKDCNHNTRIEPVGKPYREVCLCSELCPVMAHQPNSWSKQPGTRIEQVLAYCRDEQKYVGCIELLFCLTVTMTFGIRSWKLIGLMDDILPIYHPRFTEIRSKIMEK